MLKPSYAELMDVLNEHNEGADVNSRYTIVIAAAKRARQLIDGDEPMVGDYNDGKPVSTAVKELYESKIRIVGEGEGTVLNLHKKPEIDVKEELEGIKENIQSDSDSSDEEFDSIIEELEDDDLDAEDEYSEAEDEITDFTEEEEE